MTNLLVQFVQREIDELGDLNRQDRLLNLLPPKLVRYESKDGYALHDCWIVAQVSNSNYLLCIVEGRLPSVRSWGLVERVKGKYIFVSYGVSPNLWQILDDVEQMLDET